jgi:p-aminobenzoyl-glutamate transporter AbgT
MSRMNMSFIIALVIAAITCSNGNITNNDDRLALREAKPFITGIVAAVFTPFKPDGTINYPVLDDQAGMTPSCLTSLRPQDV